MRFRRHLSWNSGRSGGLLELSGGGESHEIRKPLQPATPLRLPGLANESSDSPEPGSTTLFYRLQGMMSHPSKVSF